MRANIREVKDHLSAYIHDVRKGMEVIITSHGLPVAKLIPISMSETTSTPTRKQFIHELERLRTTKKVTLKSALSETVIKRREDARY